MTGLSLAVFEGSQNRRLYLRLIAVSLCGAMLLFAEHVRAEDKVPLRLDSYETALQMKQKGDCENAVKILEPLSLQGHGHERAALNLAQCQITLAEKAATPEAAHDLLQNAVKLVIFAANAGLDDAQVELIKLTLYGGHFKVEPVEAGTWYLIWKRNPTRMQVGAGAIDKKLLDKLQSTLTDEDWKKAQLQADAFVAGE